MLDIVQIIKYMNDANYQNAINGNGKSVFKGMTGEMLRKKHRDKADSMRQGYKRPGKLRRFERAARQQRYRFS